MTESKMRQTVIAKYCCYVNYVLPKGVELLDEDDNNKTRFGEPGTYCMKWGTLYYVNQKGEHKSIEGTQEPQDSHDFKRPDELYLGDTQPGDYDSDSDDSDSDNSDDSDNESIDSEEDSKRYNLLKDDWKFKYNDSFRISERDYGIIKKPKDDYAKLEEINGIWVFITKDGIVWDCPNQNPHSKEVGIEIAMIDFEKQTITKFPGDEMA